MKIKAIISILLFAISWGAYSQKASGNFSFMFYNLENFFDTVDDTTVNDNEFLPGGAKHWTWQKFNDKAIKIIKIIGAVELTKCPDIIGVCEIENTYCSKYLIYKTPLSRLRYNYVHYESSDPRGIDVALYYNPSTFTVIDSKPLHLSYKTQKKARTRDILYCKGVMTKSSDTIHVFVNHWPSRRGGKNNSEHKRMAASNRLKNTIDSITTIETEKHFIVVMGDFNDEATDSSVMNIANADIEGEGKALYTLPLDNYAGTHKYRGHWSTLDQFFISKEFNEKYSPTGRILNFDFLLEEDNANTGKKPFRTYQGPRYLGGFSDHLPIFFDCRFP